MGAFIKNTVSEDGTLQSQTLTLLLRWDGSRLRRICQQQPGRLRGKSPSKVLRVGRGRFSKGSFGRQKNYRISAASQGCSVRRFVYFNMGGRKISERLNGEGAESRRTAPQLCPAEPLRRGPRAPPSSGTKLLQRPPQRETGTAQGRQDFLSEHHPVSAPPGEVISLWLKNMRSGQDVCHVSSSLSPSLVWETMRISPTLQPVVNTFILFFSITTSAAVSLCPTCLQLFQSRQRSFTLFSLISKYLKILHFKWIDFRSYKHQT